MRAIKFLIASLSLLGICSLSAEEGARQGMSVVVGEGIYHTTEEIAAAEAMLSGVTAGNECEKPHLPLPERLENCEGAISSHS